MKKKEREQALVLRNEGMSIKQIGKRLKVSPSSVSLWTKGIELSPEAKDKIENRHKECSSRGRYVHASLARELRASWQEEGRILAQEGKRLHMSGCMLYWAEGSKGKNSVMLTNTDPQLMEFFVKFLRECYEVKSKDMKINVYAYSGNGKTKEQIESYWLSILGLPRTCLRKTFMDYDKRSKNGNRKNIHLYGSCRLHVCSTRIVQSIFGAIQQYVGFQRPSWLR
jgi:predicted transcriptional regulator